MMLRALMALCEKNKIHLISDEVYALSTYSVDGEGSTFVSALSIDTRDLIDENRLHVLYGMSKVGICDYRPPRPSLENDLYLLRTLLPPDFDLAAL